MKFELSNKADKNSNRIEKVQKKLWDFFKYELVEIFLLSESFILPSIKQKYDAWFSGDLPECTFCVNFLFWGSNPLLGWYFQHVLFDF